MARALVAEILNEDVVRRMNFGLLDRDGAITVNPARITGLRSAVLSGRIGAIDHPFIGASAIAAAYDFLNNELLIDASLAADNSYDRSAVVHECIHALIDLYKYSGVTKLANEVAAFIGQAIYLRTSNTSLPRRGRDPQHDHIFDVADDLIVRHGLDRRPGQMLTYRQIQPLLRAVHAVYLHLRADELLTNIGVAKMPAMAP